MDVVYYFDPLNRQHVIAYKYLTETGKWPDGFLPDDVEFHHFWYEHITMKIASAWVTLCTVTIYDSK